MSGPHVVIVGGGFGGLSAAKTLRRHPGIRVTLIDRKNHHLFQPLLYQVATATLSPGDVASPIRWILRHAGNVRVLLGDVARVDVERQQVQLADGAALDYDFLILAPGVRHAYFDHPEWEQHAHGLKTLEDALDMRRRMLLAFERAERESDDRRLGELLTFVFVGGGPTGVELAGTLAEIARRTLRDEYRFIDTARARIIVIEAGPTILPAFPEPLREAARRSLQHLGIEVLEHTQVVGIDASGVNLRRAGPHSGPVEPSPAETSRINAGTIVWAAGVAASPLLRTLGTPLDRAGRARVARDLSLPGHPEVFVVGDAAAFEQDGAQLPGVAQTAIQGAAHAARTIARRIAGQPSATFVYRNLGNMAIVGRMAAIVDLGWTRFSGTLAWLAWLFLHIVLLIGFRNRLVVLVQWAGAYLTFQRSVRLITYEDRDCPARLSRVGVAGGAAGSFDDLPHASPDRSRDARGSFHLDAAASGGCRVGQGQDRRH
jgi:NADH dehydrogenase